MHLLTNSTSLTLLYAIFSMPDRRKSAGCKLMAGAVGSSLMERYNNTWQRLKRPVVAGGVLGLLAIFLTVGAAAASVRVPVNQETTLTPVGQLTLPTATPTIIGGATTSPTRTPTFAPVLAEVIGDPTNLRSLPTIGDEYIIDSVSPGITLPVLGRWLGYDWLLVAWEDGPDGKAWVYEPLVIVRGDITTVPAVEPPPPPTADPTRVALEETAMILLQTPGAAEAATATAVLSIAGTATQSALDGGLAAGPMPTFTPAPPYVQLEVLPSLETVDTERGPIPPAVLIISLMAMGLLLLVVGVIRRLF
jgi:hypothetical protein